ncbi:hypothetical protein BAY61_25610 [Prauserella marina]|nr:hypothetical protein BAY61_25610 [Prauserella marina]
MHKRRITFAAAAAALALGLSACGGDEEPQDSGAGQEASQAGPKPEPIAPEDMTPPGTELAVGETAVLPFPDAPEPGGVLGVTVTGIERGEAADIASFGEDAEGLVPYYIKVKVENLSGTDLSFAQIGMRALTADGESTGAFATSGTEVEGKCEAQEAPPGFTAAGATFETCVLDAAEDGTEVTQAEFGDLEEYAAAPIIWTA